MKFILMMIIMSLLVSCGQSGGPAASTKDARQEEQETTSTPRLDGYLDAHSVNETELLNVSINEAVNVAEDSIVFNRPVNIQDHGMRITCSLTMSAGEIWHLRRTVDGMEIQFPSGARESLRPIGSRSEAFGTWSSNVTKDNVRIRRRYSFLPNRLIINQDCEQ